MSLNFKISLKLTMSRQKELEKIVGLKDYRILNIRPILSLIRSIKLLNNLLNALPDLKIFYYPLVFLVSFAHLTFREISINRLNHLLKNFNASVEKNRPGLKSKIYLYKFC